MQIQQNRLNNPNFQGLQGEMKNLAKNYSNFAEIGKKYNVVGHQWHSNLESCDNLQLKFKKINNGETPKTFFAKLFRAVLPKKSEKTYLMFMSNKDGKSITDQLKEVSIKDVNDAVRKADINDQTFIG